MGKATTKQMMTFDVKTDTDQETIAVQWSGPDAPQVIVTDTGNDDVSVRVVGGKELFVAGKLQHVTVKLLPPSSAAQGWRVIDA